MAPAENQREVTISEQQAFEVEIWPKLGITQSIVLQHLCEGYTVKESSDYLGISTKTLVDVRKSIAQAYLETHPSLLGFNTHRVLINLIQDGISQGHINYVNESNEVVKIVPEEKRFTDLLCAGYTNDEIALETNQTVYTIKRRLQNLRQRLNARNDFQLISRLTSLRIENLLSVVDFLDSPEMAPFKMSERHLRMMELTAKGLSILQIANIMNTTANNIRNYRRDLSRFGYNKHIKGNEHPIRETLLALIQDGINFGYLNIENNNNQDILLTNEENTVMNLLADGYDKYSIREITKFSHRKLSSVISGLSTKLKSKNIFQQIANFTLLKNAGKLRISDETIEDLRQKQFDEQSPTKQNIIIYLANGYTAMEISNIMNMPINHVVSHIESFESKYLHEMISFVGSKAYLNQEGRSIENVIFTRHEYYILRQFANGNSSEEISERTGLSKADIEQVKNILITKLRGRNYWNTIARYSFLKKMKKIKIPNKGQRS